jgi:hypothetical protein
VGTKALALVWLEIEIHPFELLISQALLYLISGITSNLSITRFSD